MKLYHWFIPNKKNKFHPIALRSVGLVVFLIFFIAIQFVYNITSAHQFKVLGYATSVTAGDLSSLSNQERTNAGLAPLNLNASLASAALAKANHMIANNYWAHVAPDGTTPWYFCTAAGYPYTAAGENLAKDFGTSSGVVNGWMRSDSHKANVLSTSYKDVGYAVVNGTLLGSQTTLVVAMYGLQDEPIVAPPIATTTQTESSQPDATVQETAEPTVSTNNTQVSVVESEVPKAADTAIVNPIVVEDTKSQTATTNPSKLNEITAPETPIAKTDSITDIGSIAGATITLPIKTYNSLNWGQKASLLLVSTLILLFIMKHTLIWREQKRGFRHIWLRAHPLGQAVILTTVLVVTALSGAGTVL